MAASDSPRFNVNDTIELWGVQYKVRELRGGDWFTPAKSYVVERTDTGEVMRVDVPEADRAAKPV